MQNRLQINPFTINELSPIGFIAERWEFHENKRVGNKIKIPFSFLGLFDIPCSLFDIQIFLPLCLCGEKM